MRSLLIMTMLLMLTGSLLASADARIIATKNGKAISLSQMAKELKKYDVVFFGEYHDDAILHELQIQLLPLLYKNDKRLIVSFEMFERDVQADLDAYLAGEIDEDEFLSKSRPWPNYSSDYRPLLEYAREKGLQAVAANIPRRLAGLVARNSIDALKELSNDDRILMALDVSAPEGEYKRNFLATMQANGMHASPGEQDLYDRLFYAQCMKDDTMAESIAQYLERYPRHKLIHFNGDFHSRSFLGTVERLKSRMPKAKIAVISPQFESMEMPKKPSSVANYLIIVPDRTEEENP